MTPHFRRNSRRAREFRLNLDIYIAVTEPIARSIECIEAVRSNPCDVFVFWAACVAMIREALTDEDLEIPPEVCAQIRLIVNSRWREMFKDNDLYLTAFYLNPCKFCFLVLTEKLRQQLIWGFCQCTSNLTYYEVRIRLLSLLQFRVLVVRHPQTRFLRELATRRRI